MQFDSFEAFIAMSTHGMEHGFFVWLSYGISTALIALLIFNSLFSHKQLLKQLKQKQKRDQKLKQAAAKAQEPEPV